MEFKSINNFKLPVIGLGTYRFGGYKEADYSNDEESIRTLKEAINLGYTFIDTAEVYGDNHCEELIGEAIKEFDRSKLFIVTKVDKLHLKYDDVIFAAKASLRRLKTNYIDLYLIHAPNPNILIEETMKAMNYLVEQKLVKFIGVSNFEVHQLKEAQKYSKNKIVVNEIEYSLLTRDDGDYNNKDMESKTVPYCQENDILIITERPLERGLLTKPHYVLDSLCNKYNKTRSQIAINWLISKKNIVTIPMSSNIEHLKENLGAIGWNLSSEDIKLLDKTNFESLK